MSEEIHRLYDSHHSYYCNEENYYAGSETMKRFCSWAEFEEESKADPDLNLLFRWDWRAKYSDDNVSDDYIPGSDPYYRDGDLVLFWMGQRKGLFRTSIVEVCQADEPAVRAWLEARWRHLRNLWSPLDGTRGSCDCGLGCSGAVP